MDKAAPPFSFETAYAKLEAILSELNNGATPLEKSLELYRRGQSVDHPLFFKA